jgi:hypothetical protein
VANVGFIAGSTWGEPSLSQPSSDELAGIHRILSTSAAATVRSQHGNQLDPHAGSSLAGAVQAMPAQLPSLYSCPLAPNSRAKLDPLRIRICFLINSRSANKGRANNDYGSRVIFSAIENCYAAPRSVIKELPLRYSALVDTQVIYCGDNLDQLRRLPDSCVDLIYIDPPFNSSRTYEVFWEEKREKRAFDDRHESTKAYIEFMRPRCIELARVSRPRAASTTTAIGMLATT